MTPRVRAALVQFLTPITSSTEDRTLSPLNENKNQSFQRHKLLRLSVQKKGATVNSPSQVSVGLKTYRDTLQNWKGSLKALRGIILDKKDNSS